MYQHEITQYAKDRKRQKADRSARSIALSLATLRSIAASKKQRLIHILAAVALPAIAGAVA